MLFKYIFTISIISLVYNIESIHFHTDSKCRSSPYTIENNKCFNCGFSYNGKNYQSIFVDNQVLLLCYNNCVNYNDKITFNGYSCKENFNGTINNFIFHSANL